MKRIAIVGAAALATACVSRYSRPTRAEPHASVEVRRIYGAVAGTTLFERLLADDQTFFQGDAPARYARAPLSDVSLVHPVAATFTMHSSFFHSEARQVLETYDVEEAHQGTETYRCNFGRGASFSHGTCKRSVMLRRVVQRSRWVKQIQQVTDGACQAQRRFAALPGHVYVLLYEYRGPGVCWLSCFEQVANADSSTDTQACPLVP